MVFNSGGILHSLIKMVVEWVLDNPDLGWVVVALYLMWEIRGPKGKIASIKHDIRSVTIVVRALARVHQDIETDKVDDFLAEENDSEPIDFLDFDQYTSEDFEEMIDEESSQD